MVVWDIRQLGDDVVGIYGKGALILDVQEMFDLYTALRGFMYSRGEQNEESEVD